MLILPHSDAFRFYFNEFGKGIHKATTDRDGATHCYVIIRKFFSCHSGSRIDTRSAFTNHKSLNICIKAQLLYKLFGFSSGSTIPYCYSLYLVLLNKGSDFFCCQCPLIFRRVRIDSIVMKQISLSIKAYNLTSGTKSRVDTHSSFLS